MADRYISAPERAVFWDPAVGLVVTPETVVVHEADAAPQPTGLFDVDGRPLYRVPLGFHGRKVVV